MQVPSELLVTVSFALLLAYAVLAGVDGLYIHLYRLRLHARPESRREHWLHTGRAILFPMTLASLYAVDAAGWLLWSGFAIVIADLVVGARDLWCEAESRESLGGLTALESTLHGVLVMLQTSSTTLLLAVKPASAWLLAAPPVMAESYGPFADLVVLAVLPGAVAVAFLHLWLALAASGSRREAAVYSLNE